MTDQRALFEAAVVDRMKESGFLEIEIRTECLVRCDDGYQDEIINAGWHYWNAALATTEPSKPVAEAVKVKPVGYVTKNELTKLSLGASCVDLFGKVVPKGFEMVPVYSSPRENWQPIETAPKDGEWVFLYWPTMSISMYPFVAFCVGDEYGWEGAAFTDYGEVFPTHWMPIPSAPALIQEHEESKP